MIMMKKKYRLTEHNAEYHEKRNFLINLYEK